MSETSPRPVVTETMMVQPNVAHAALSDSDNETLKVQRRFRLSGNGPASRALQVAVLAFLKQKEN
ncbi:hypothetical protein [Rhodoferax saidenbachensis]|uniref:Uncharacterized protein n=1 Tax=Rhodoferax saidenbachensis TaxID=1484693 RepID=A0ABU1ZHP4_9BURK|nr:hypothetical protein [Rhodoferax saidenbachensis]MDR7305059.1 hypothetical protein [Rhodoferax saidenbachensis]